MPKMNVSKSIIINASKEKIKEFLADFHNWKNWSPWLICEPEATVNYAEDGKYYKWEGNRVGSGEMSVLNESDNSINYDLTFLKPWKSKAKVAFNFKDTQEGTEVEWTMESSLPFFMFWMKKSMQIYIGMDYERGLRMLKEEIEEGTVHSKIEIMEVNNFEGGSFIGKKTDTAFSKIAEAMEKDFGDLKEYIAKNNIDVIGVPFSEYQKFNLVKDNVVYVTGFPVKEKPDNLPNDFFFGNLSKRKMQTVRHTGKYEHLGNAWSTIMMMERNKEFKKDKKGAPLEIYINDPSQAKPEEMIVDISMPIL
ncbi:SRPBCC family protein [Tenacibaculum amylolyticum]|uniref:SRPBCC family protein n=1 Tax=Tenacibaculum amylolyticum TaxID=104269 RepID=UPI0038938CCB